MSRQHETRRAIFLRTETHARLKEVSDDTGASMSELLDRIVLSAINEWKPGDPPPRRTVGKCIPRGTASHKKEQP